MPEKFGRYRIMRALGRGGMGAVYLAHDAELDRQVALKVPRFNAEDGTDVIERFRRKAKTAAMLTHPNICPRPIGLNDGSPRVPVARAEHRSVARVGFGSQPFGP